jgi:hypothetical protein
MTLLKSFLTGARNDAGLHHAPIGVKSSEITACACASRGASVSCATSIAFSVVSSIPVSCVSLSFLWCIPSPKIDSCIYTYTCQKDTRTPTSGSPRVQIKDLYASDESRSFLSRVFINPDIPATRTIPTHSDPFLLPLNRILMDKETGKPLATVRTLTLKRLLIPLPADRIHQGPRRDRIRIRTRRTKPGDRNPLPLPIHSLILIQPHSLLATLRTLLLNNPSPNNHKPDDQTNKHLLRG